MVPVNKSRIAVLGCGWLGFPLATELIKKDFEVYGTTTKIDKLQRLIKNGIKGYLLNLPDIDNEGADLWSCDTFIINIPPGRRNPDYAALYPSRINVLVSKILSGSSDPRIIFVSTTGVYKNTGSQADEAATLVEEHESVLLRAENIVLRGTKKSVILRMAGLAGPGRNPGNWFAGKVDIPGGDTPINMVHQEDCISIISRIIQDNTISGVYNVCGDEHPKKKEFYVNMSKQNEVELPIFNEGLVPYKIVKNKKLKDKLKYSYLFSNPMFFSYE